jgi:hypothetical protein
LWLRPGAYPRVEHLKATFTWAGPSLVCKHHTRMERLVRDKHSSLLQKSVNYSCTKFYSTGPWALVAFVQRQNIFHLNVYLLLFLFSDEHGDIPFSCSPVSHHSGSLWLSWCKNHLHSPIDIKITNLASIIKDLLIQ